MDNQEQQLFLTKSFWAPIVAFIVSKYAAAAMGLTPDEQTMMTGAGTILAVAIVRLVTKRGAYLVKPKGDQGP